MAPTNMNLQLGNGLDSRILQTLYELQLLGFKEVPESLIANSLGYRNPHNYVFVNSVRTLLGQRLLQKNPVGQLGLTEQTCALLKILIDARSPASTSDWHQRLENLLGVFLPTFFPLVWQALCDGATHTMDGLAKTAGRQHVNSQCNLRSIVKTLKYLGLLEQLGMETLKLSEGAFPFGRP